MSEDLIDAGCKMEEQQRNEALENHKNRQTFTPLIIDGVRCCVDCEYDITARLVMLPDAVRCVICQEQFENHYRANF